MSKLRKFEIDAIVSSIIDNIESGIRKKDVSKDVDKAIKLQKEVNIALRTINQNIDHVQSITDGQRVIGWHLYRSGFNERNETKIDLRKIIMSHKVREELPQRNEVERMVILSNNKDLSGIVEEITNEFLKK